MRINANIFMLHVNKETLTTKFKKHLNIGTKIVIVFEYVCCVMGTAKRQK